MGQKHSGGTRIGGGRTVVVIGGDVDAGHPGGGGDGIGIINEDDESETPETCGKWKCFCYHSVDNGRKYNVYRLSKRVFDYYAYASDRYMM